MSSPGDDPKNTIAQSLIVSLSEGKRERHPYILDDAIKLHAPEELLHWQDIASSRATLILQFHQDNSALTYMPVPGTENTTIIAGSFQRAATQYEFH